MPFNSLEFIFIFLPLSLIAFFVIGGRGYYQIAIFALVVASLIFYGWWNPSYLILLILSMGFNYFIGYILNQSREKQSNKKLILIIGIVVNLLLLGYYKYANFFIDQLDNIIGVSLTLSPVILPLGISFFTFTQITYLVDSYKGETKEYNFLNFTLFVSFFPYLTSGPIVHYKEILPQFIPKSAFHFKAENLALGITIFVVGLFKKVVIADGLIASVTPVFEAATNGGNFNFMDAWIGALSYTFQLYFDFSGYSEMAIGASTMFGIKLPINFYSPYKAINITDFWRRWHISLSNFLRDYLYIPLGGNRKGEIRRYANLIITMLLGGLWHGAGWTFIIWGGLHGLYLVINNLWHSFLKKMGVNLKQIPWWSKVLGVLITFIAVIIAWVLFRAENLTSGLLILTEMSGINGINFNPSIVESNKKLLIGLSIFVWFFPNILQLLKKYDPVLQYNIDKTSWELTLNKNVGFVVGILMFITFKYLLDAPASQFLYFNF